MKNEKIDSLQVFRAIAAILVVLFHITSYSQERYGYTFLDNRFAFGYTGVDFFFVLSGFIIFYIHVKDVGNRQQIQPYVAKRLLRIFPIYWIITFAKVSVIFLLPALAKSYERESGVIIASFLLFPQRNLPIIGAAWTLSYELFFYMLFGMAIWLGYRRGLYLFAGWTILVLGYVIGKAAGLTIFPDHYLIRFALNERNLEFILGCLSAYIAMNYKVSYPKFVAITGGLLFLAAGLYVSNGGRVPSYTVLFGLPSLLLVTGSASIELQRYVRFPKLLVFLGNASYSIYLTHAMFVNIFTVIFDFLNWTNQLPPSVLMSTIAIGAILGGSAVYQFLERPLLSLLRRKLLTAQTNVIQSSSSSQA
jgi:peptidoglycan/LPS O-acetylase OafA/YrhL